MNKIKNIRIVLFGFSTGVFIEFIGRLLISEIIALFRLPFLNLVKLFRKYSDLKGLSICFSLFLISQIISDVVNETTFQDYSRGLAMIVFAYISTLYFIHIIGQNFKNIIFLLLGIFIVKLFLVEEDIDTKILEESTNYFKVRYVVFLNPLILLISYLLLRINYKWAVLSLINFYAIVCLILDARSNGLIFLISGIIFFFLVKKVRLKKSNVVLISSFVIPVLYVLYVYYVDLVLKEKIGGGNALSQLRLAKNPYNPFELLFYGRVDFFVLIEAIKDKFVFGHGSWGKDPGGYYANIAKSLLGNEFSTYGEGGYIRAHSILLGSWTYSGILGFLAICVLFIQLFKAAWFVLKNNLKNPYLAIVIVFTVSMLWDLFFSPLGSLRTSFPFFAAIIIVAKYHLNEIKSFTYG